MTFLQLQQNVYRKTGYADSPATEVSTRVKMFLNEIHRRMLALPGMDYLRVGQTTLTTVANVSLYGLPYDVSRIMAIRDTANDRTLTSQSFAWYAAQEPDPSAITGDAELWVPVGYDCVQFQPSDASTCYVVSSAAGDTTQTVYVEGIRAGVLTTASVTLNGTTKVSLGAWTRFHKVYLSAAATGTVAIWEDDVTTGTLLATLPIGKTNFRYFSVALWPTPTDATALTVDYIRTVEDLVNNTDEPLLPEDFHSVLAAGARMLEYERADDSRHPVAKAEYQRGVSDLRWWVTTRADEQSMMGHGRTGSRLGPWFPRGS
jgi:hypothetical protein